MVSRPRTMMAIDDVWMCRRMFVCVRCWIWRLSRKVSMRCHSLPSLEDGETDSNVRCRDLHLIPYARFEVQAGLLDAW